MTSFAVDLHVRADEDSVFVPADLVPGAVVGDVVTVRSTHLDATRTGTIAEVIDDGTRGRFCRLAFT